MNAKTKLLIVFFLAIFAICIYFVFGIFSPPGAGMYVQADKLQDQPDKFVEFSFADLEKYPYVKQAVVNPGNSIEIPSDNHEGTLKFQKIIQDNGTDYIKVNNEYYEIALLSAD